MLQKCLLTLVLFSLVFSAPISIFIAGDSTAANKDTSGGKVERGWGQMFQKYWKQSNVVIKNFARNGRSSKSFISDGLLKQILDQMKKGDYCIVQFGHNDAKTEKERHTEPGSTFDQYLGYYVKEIKKKGGIPVLMSPVVRCSWKNGVLVDTHGGYRLSAKNVATKYKVNYVDANALTEKLEKSLGEAKSKKLHMIYEPGEIPSLPEGKQDTSHYNINGATQVAKILATALAKEIPALANYKIN